MYLFPTAATAPVVINELIVTKPAIEMSPLERSVTDA